MANTLLLSILIPTLEKRRREFYDLVDYLHRLVDLHALDDVVEIAFLSDDGQMPTGTKRRQLYEMANGLYSWQIDDDDTIPSSALLAICNAARAGQDCITFEERCLIDNKEYRSNFSLKYEDWADNQDGFDYVRTPFFKTPILTELCLKAEIPPITWGEDHAFARAVKPLLKSEIHIPHQLYHYIKNNQR
jgi:hypothetical protein